MTRVVFNRSLDKGGRLHARCNKHKRLAEAQKGKEGKLAIIIERGPILKRVNKRKS